MKLKDLVGQKRVVEGEIAERQEELRALEVLINRQRQREGLPAEVVPSLGSTNNNGNGEKQARTRGTLKAAKKAADAMPGAFTRAELFTKVETDSPPLAGKISPEAQRSTIRTLLKDGFITVENEALGTYRGVHLS